MDVDAKGQVGGLEMSEQGRRELAEESRAWRCGVEGCNGGKTNEEVLREWREGVCRERGVVDEESGGGEGEKQEKQEDETQESDAAQSTSAPVAEPAPEPALEEPQEPSRGSSQPQPQPQQQPIPSSTPQHQPRPQTQLQFQPQPVTTTATATTATAVQDSPWLDRAIIGVLIALIVTIMRRVFRDEDGDL